jgi:phenylpropionate dioxygenase-like ring-hydroxylating dioxygenase large terminal subunit
MPPTTALHAMPYCTSDRNMLDDWLTVGPVPSLQGCTEARPRRTRLLGAELALWQDTSGVPQARGADGQPLRIEAHYGYLWVCPSGQPARPLFALPEHADPERRIVDCAGLGVGVTGLRIVENFLDMAHFPFVHTHYLGELPHTEVADYRVQLDAQTDEIWATECVFPQPMASAAASQGVLARYRYRVMQPLTAMLYKTCVHRSDALDGICLFVQPLDETHSVAHVLLLYFEPDLSDTELIAFQHLIFAQDKPILENHVHPRIPLHAGVETPTRADATSVTYRRWLKRRGQQFGVMAP